MDVQALKTKLSEYDSIVCVDRSGSMADTALGFASRWDQAKEITTGIAGLASQVDEDGITMISFGGGFKASRDVVDGVKLDAVTNLFTNQSPAGGTPLAEALDAAFQKKFAAGKKAVIFVITDGVPDSQDRVKTSIMGAAAKLTDPSEIRILFLQVGDDKSAGKYLSDLDEHLDGVKFDIVNSIGYEEANNLTAIELYERAISDTH